MWQLWLTICGPLLPALALPVREYPGYEVLAGLREAEQLLRAVPRVDGLPAQADEPARPHVAARFSAPMTFISTDTGMPSVGSGLFAQDLSEKDQKIVRVEALRPFPGDESMTTNLTSLLLGDDGWDITGGSHPICRKLPMFGPQHAADFFSWAAAPAISVYKGQRVIGGRACAQWQLHSNATTSKLSLCADGDIPVELNMSSVLNKSAAVHAYNFSYRFGPLTVGSEVPEFLFEKPSICGTNIPSCENGRGKAATLLDAYVFHPGLSPGDYNIEDQNVADLMGDALFICMDCLSNQTSFIDHNYSLISRYTLEVSPAFGQYALCNGYPDTTPPGPLCVGGDPRLVGKEAPFFAGDGESRCADASPIGFWYGLPKAGHCPPGVSPSKDAWAGGCTWSIVKRLKTIHQACLLKDHSYLEVCKADFLEKKSFSRSVAALEAAFTSEDPAKGGCADVGGPDGESTIVV